MIPLYLQLIYFATLVHTLTVCECWNHENSGIEMMNAFVQYAANVNTSISKSQICYIVCTEGMVSPLGLDNILHLSVIALSLSPVSISSQIAYYSFISPKYFYLFQR